ncbi:Thrombospondin-4-B [Liparis tanakae]|uniref:Thrombospondin-4-B n=1 Tax=Liparis tanakae TaxID=230148 RepID=A0A4Z2FEX4_9TELE|nr:Thrombospondin-4-B [Liparis tanakae]
MCFFKIKETAFLRNTITECLPCGVGGQPPPPGPTPGPAQSVLQPQPLTQCPPGTCFTQSMCLRSESGGFRCAACPEGSAGDGVRCADVDELHPCHRGVRCVNTAPGFRCEDCPPGYSGPEVSGVGAAYAEAHRQVCHDVDECLGPTANGGCTANSRCHNTDGSFRCGECDAGFTGDQTRGCRGARLCPNGRPDPCDAHAQCVVERDGSISCEVSERTATRRAVHAPLGHDRAAQGVRGSSCNPKVVGSIPALPVEVSMSKALNPQLQLGYLCSVYLYSVQ